MKAYHCRVLTRFAACAATLVALPLASGQELFRDEMTSGAGWGVNAITSDNAATFGYDYSADFIPEAPNSQGGDTGTTGVKLESNLTAGALDGFSLYPVGQSFSGQYTLRFDAWMNYDANEAINGEANGTTEFLGGGIGYNNTSADVNSGAQAIATGDGGSGSDWRVFKTGFFVTAADMAGGSRNGGVAYYADFLPGVAPPAGQAQAAFPPGIAGSPAFQWITWEFSVNNNLVDVTIEKPNGDRLLIAKLDGNNTADGSTGFSGSGNIMLFYADFFSSVTARPDLTFGIVDNVVVTKVPEPASAALALAALGACVLLRRRPA